MEARVFIGEQAKKSGLCDLHARGADENSPRKERSNEIIVEKEGAGTPIFSKTRFTFCAYGLLTRLPQIVARPRASL